MAPGLNGRQTGAVPKNRPRTSGSQSHRSVREPLVQSSSLEWEPVLDQNSCPRSKRKLSSAHSEAEADCIRYDLACSLPSAMTSQIRFEENMNENNGQEINGCRSRQLPDKKQVINKITQIQDYIQQTATLMNALKTSDCPEKRKQYEQLSTILLGLQDSERKLSETLKDFDSSDAGDEAAETVRIVQGDNTGNSSDNNEELVRRTEESKRKLELLQKRKQELIELQEKARKQLQEAQMEQSRLVARASTLNQDINSNKFLDFNVQQLSQRIKSAQQLFKTGNQIHESLDDAKDMNVEEAEHPDEDQIEMSDTETDFQIVSDKVAELNMMKAQLAQIQKIMANISIDPNGKEGPSICLDIGDERREQGMQQQQQQKSMRSEISDENSNNALKLEQAKLKLSQLTQLLEIAQSVQGPRVVPSNYLQVGCGSANGEGDAVRRSPSPGCSSKSQQRPSDEVYVETMQLMTRELEERTAAVKEEHERLIAARQEIESIARKIPLVKGERMCPSPDDSGSEAPCLTNISLESSVRSGHSKARPRGVWNAFVPSINIGSQEKKCKNEDMSRSLHQISGIQNSLQRDQQLWSPSPTVSFCDNASCSGIQSQNHMDKMSNPYGRMVNEVVPRPIRPDEITVEELYAQHQMLTRTVAQCSHLLWLQQKQIIELRNALMLQQSTMFQNALPQSAYVGHPQRNASGPHQSFQYSPAPGVPYPVANQMQIQQEQTYMSPNQSVKLNSVAMSNAQGPQDFSDQFYQQSSIGGLPISLPDVPDYQFRYVNYNRPGAQGVNSNSNVNQNFNQSAPSCLNNRVPVGGVSCLGPEDSGALNNQVPPGNRANNYWDNFRSYSRQNLLSHSKSNEDTDANRRSSTSSNQERLPRETPSSAAIQNNAPTASSANEGPIQSSAHGTTDPTDYDEYQYSSGPQGSATRPNRAQVSRSRSAEMQGHRSSVKNESRCQENDSRNLNPKNEAGTSGARARIPEAEMIRSHRNDVCPPGRNSESGNGSSNRNFVQLVRDLDADDARRGINKKRLDKAGSRGEGCGNLNNRVNCGPPFILRDNVYSEVTNFIRTNENHPHFLIQLFRDLQQVTTDPLRQRTLESIQETVNANNLAERSNINGANLNIIDNRNNIRENRSNLNRNHSEEPNLYDGIACQIRENHNTFRQNIGGGGGGGGGGNSTSSATGNLENPNISNIRNFGNPRNNLESEGLRDLRTYFEANLCNFGHNSALENPNLSNIRENLTRRGTAASDLDNGNPKNLYLSMYDNMGRRNQECGSGPELPFQPQNFRNSDLFATEQPANGFRGNNDGSRSSNNQFPFAAVGPRPEMRGDGNFAENCRPTTPRMPPTVERDNYENVTQEFQPNPDCSEAANFNVDAKKRGGRPGSCEDGLPIKNDEVPEENNLEEEGAAALVPPEWDRNSPENRPFAIPGNQSRGDASAEPIFESSHWKCNTLEEVDNGDLAEADQSRNEEAAGAESSNSLANLHPSEIAAVGANEGNHSPPRYVAEVRSSGGKRKRKAEEDLGPEGSSSDIRETESDVDYYYENSSEYEEHCPCYGENTDYECEEN